jgi:hypothetical protein
MGKKKYMSNIGFKYYVDRNINGRTLLNGFKRKRQQGRE